MLSSIPVPAMPEQLTSRLQAVIANEAAMRSAGTTMPARSASDPGVAGEPTSTMIPGRPDLPERAGRRRARRPRARVWSSPLALRSLAAAGVLVLLVGGGILLANGRGAQTRNTAGSEPASRPARNRPSSAIVGSGAATPLRYRHAGQLVYASAVRSDADYTKASLPAGVRDEVKASAQVASPAPGVAPSGAAPSTSRLNGASVSQLESCLSAVATGHLVLLVDVARYLGRPATIIVLKPVNNVFDVIVVGQACGTSGQNVITRLTVPKE
jgi:hypothetical protein